MPAAEGPGQPPLPGAPADLSRPAVSGVAWQGLSLLLGRGFTLVATVILARLLTPADFGIVALALVFITFAEQVSDFGISEGLIYFRRDRRNEDGALILTLLAGTLLCGLGLLSAPVVGDLFEEPDLVPMVRVLAFALLMGALRQVPDALLRRELQFRRRVIAELSRGLTQGVVSIALALAGLGAWALIWGYLAGTAVWCASTWLLSDYRPSLGFWRVDRAVSRQLLAYGAPAAAQGLLAAVIFDVDYVILGQTVGSEALGTYSLAFRLPQLLIINVFFVLSAVAFPIYSHASESAARLKSGYLTAFRMQCAYGLAASVGLFITAPLLVSVVFGDKWSDAVSPLRALALYAGFRALGAGAVDLYKGTGRPGLAAKVSLVRLAILVPVLLVAAQDGIVAVGWAQAGLALLFAIGMQSVASRVVGFSVAELWRAVRPALVIAAGTAAGAGSVVWLMPGSEEIQLALALPVAAACGVGAVWLVDAGAVQEMKELLSGRAVAAA